MLREIHHLFISSLDLCWRDLYRNKTNFEEAF
jgi:hypothetical protein